MTVRSEAAKAQVLVVGASFAGLSTAYWMHRLGYAVTVVEVAGGLRMGGTPVNIEGNTVELVRRMGLLERVQANSLPVRSLEFVDAAGRCTALMTAQPGQQAAGAPEYEIERNELLKMQYDDVKDDVTFLFSESVAAMEERENEVLVRFKSGAQAAFALAFGCDGNHSSVRRLCFGEEARYSVFLRNYFSITIVDRLLLEEDTSQIYNIPGKTVMLNGYNGKTDIVFCFSSAEEIPYDYRDQEQQRRMILEQFEGAGWRTAELLSEMSRSQDFYFDKLCQIRMPCWTAGRVALVGDAAYCASPAAGMGGSLAIVGAAALADAFQKHPEDYRAAFQEYNRSLRPLIDKVQAEAIDFGLETFAPSTEEAIRARNARLNGERGPA